MQHIKLYIPCYLRNLQCAICWENYKKYERKTCEYRKEIKANQCGLGTHFFKHAEEMGINMDSNMEQIMQYFKLFIITFADKYSEEEWKDMEARLMQTLKTTEEHGGMNIILERKHDQKQYKCKQCDFRAIGSKHIYEHKKREHSDYKLLCDVCGYMTKVNSNFNRHVRVKHPEYL